MIGMPGAAVLSCFTSDTYALIFDADPDRQ